MHLKVHYQCMQALKLKETHHTCDLQRLNGTLKANKNTQHGLIALLENMIFAKKAPSWKIFIMWKQTGTGGEDVLGNMVQTNASNVNTRGLSSGKFTIDLQGKQMG